MQRKVTKNSVSESNDVSITVNHHQSPVVGGTGHVSLEGQCGDEKISISVYPTTRSPFSMALSVLTGHIVPTRAKHISPSHPEYQNCSPISSSYKIPPGMLSHPHKAFNEMKKISHSVNSGSTGFSVMPNFLLLHYMQ